jgi:hypothetical protein
MIPADGKVMIPSIELKQGNPGSLPYEHIGGEATIILPLMEG